MRASDAHEYARIENEGSADGIEARESTSVDEDENEGNCLADIHRYRKARRGRRGE